MPRVSILSIVCLAAAALPLAAQGPAFDNSGNSRLNGTYYFRHVLYDIDNQTPDQSLGNIGNVDEGIAVYGTVDFHGDGTYAITGGTVMDSGIGFTESLSCWIAGYTGGCSSNDPVPGNYTISASGFGFMDNPITGDQIYGMVGANGVFVGSSTETNNTYNDLFIAAILNTSSLPNVGTFNGSYTVAGIIPYFYGYSSLYAEDMFFPLNADGQGRLGSVNVTGYQGGNGNQMFSQSFSNLTYSFSSGAGIINFPTSQNGQFFSGQEFVYFTPDGQFFFGGSPLGWDMIVGVSNASGAPGFGGTYYETGMDMNFADIISNASSYVYFDGYYGAFNTTSDGYILAHERVSDTISNYTFGETFPDTFPPSVTGSYTDNASSVQFFVGDNGTARIGQGLPPYLGLKVGVQAPAMTPTTSVWINPTGIVNAASFSPFTAGVSNGAFLTIYGSNLAPNTVVASGVPYPTNLGGVQVLVNGVAAPIYFVSPGQISVLTPTGNPFGVAQFQVFNNGNASNVVTELVNTTTPGVFTVPNFNGLGDGAIIHADGSVVSPDSPAVPGEFVSVFLTGLGPVYPLVPDGAAPPISPLSNTSNTITADLNGTPATVQFAGLAPTLAGLYQVNIQIPSTAAAGDNYLGITGPDSYATQALITVAGTGSARPAAVPHVAGRTRPGSQMHARTKPHCSLRNYRTCKAQ